MNSPAVKLVSDDGRAIVLLHSMSVQQAMLWAAEWWLDGVLHVDREEDESLAA